ncbi:hypothetical protein AAFP35_10070 [Gordonia sp. CPCC 206044]|uniref:hypothetical protein n=1 Tax=Gordonia sp. CPCC 206044 TaxID=3140793 RepID=UPI003AF39107
MADFIRTSTDQGTEFSVRPTGDSARTYRMPEHSWALREGSILEVYNGANLVTVYAGSWTLELR